MRLAIRLQRLHCSGRTLQQRVNGSLILRRENLENTIQNSPSLFDQRWQISRRDIDRRHDLLRRRRYGGYLKIREIRLLEVDRGAGKEVEGHDLLTRDQTGALEPRPQSVVDQRIEKLDVGLARR